MKADFAYTNYYIKEIVYKGMKQLAKRMNS